MYYIFVPINYQTNTDTLNTTINTNTTKSNSGKFLIKTCINCTACRNNNNIG